MSAVYTSSGLYAMPLASNISHPHDETNLGENATRVTVGGGSNGAADDPWTHTADPFVESECRSLRRAYAGQPIARKSPVRKSRSIQLRIFQ